MKTCRGKNIIKQWANKGHVTMFENKYKNCVTKSILTNRDVELIRLSSI